MTMPAISSTHFLSISAALMLGSLPALAIPPATAPTNQALTCGNPADANAILPATDTVSLAGTGFSVSLGLNRDYGGVVSSFRLARTGAGGGSADVIEARSSAGAGIQSGYNIFAYAPPRTNLLFNQGVGNALGRQWGYGASLVPGSSASSSYVNASGWTPVYNDTMDADGVVHGSSPCAPTPPYTAIFDDGALDLATAQAATAAGTAVLMTHQYSWRSRVDQFWSIQYYYHALYLSRRVARMGNLRLYVHSPNGGVDGPIHPQDSMASATASYGLCGGSTTVYCTPPATDYLVLVWTIFGLDIGVAVRMTGGGTQLRLGKTQYCADPADDGCGEIDIQVVSPNRYDVAFPASSIRSYAVDYRIGTLPQLDALGFHVR